MTRLPAGAARRVGCLRTLEGTIGVHCPKLKSPATARDAIIIGAGIAGLAAGTALRRAGYQVTLYEKASSLEPRGAALSLWPNAKQALRRLGMLAAVEAVSAHIDFLSIAMKSGRPVTSPVPLQDPGLVVQRTDLQKALAEPLHDVIHLGSAVTEVRADHLRPGVLVDDHEVSADLVVDASGVHSRIADSLVENSPSFRGFGGVVAISEPSDEPQLSSGYEWLSSGARAGLFPLRRGRTYWYFTCDQSDEDATLSLAELPNEHEIGPQHSRLPSPGPDPNAPIRLRYMRGDDPPGSAAAKSFASEMRPTAWSPPLGKVPVRGSRTPPSSANSPLA